MAKKVKKRFKTWHIVLMVFIGLGIVFSISDSCERKAKLEEKEAVNTEFMEAIGAGDLVKARKMLNLFYEQYNKSSMYSRGQYYEYADMLFDAEVGRLIASGDLNPDSVIYVLSNIKIDGNAIAEGTKYYSKYSFKDEECRNHERYIESVNRYNQKCDRMFGIALANKDYELAERIIAMFKDVPAPLYYSTGNDSVDNYMEYSSAVSINAREKLISSRPVSE